MHIDKFTTTLRLFHAENVIIIIIMNVLFISIFMQIENLHLFTIHILNLQLN